jgi:hypothetical protein
MTRRRRCPACNTPNALLVREGIGGRIVICRYGCERKAIVRLLDDGQEHVNRAIELLDAREERR